MKDAVDLTGVNSDDEEEEVAVKKEEPKVNRRS